ncbi:MAG: gliding motility-associated C-terminal domain-containing protein [Chitinophagaceae bacterium]
MQRIPCFLLPFFAICFAYGQTCTNPGQNPQTAFPVCGTTTFTQNSVPLCGNRNIVSPCGATAGLSDKNPYWYKFKCYSPGTLGFVISPLGSNEDYDWQLFNVTGVTNLDEVYTNSALFVTCSWSGSFGNTGASSAGSVAFACAGGTPLFTRMPSLVAGNDYLLLISHYSNGQSGYNLSFGGGTASITDTLVPHLATAFAACDGITVNIKLNKQMRCNTLARDGSDFTINSGVTNFIAATGFGCSGGFDLDSLQLTLDSALPPGTYRLKVKNGTDANTLLDLCGNLLPVEDSVDLVVPVQVPVPMDSLLVAACSPQFIDLIFSSSVLCNSIAADGSDFTVTGPSAVTVVQALGNCNGAGTTKNIRVSMAGPIKAGGIYSLRLKTGSDGNTLVNDCAQSTPAGSTLNFIVKDSVAAAFNYTVIYKPCLTEDSVSFANQGGNGVNQWHWTFPGATPPTSSLQNQMVAFNAPGIYNVALKVSNGFCEDSATVPVTINAVQKDLVAPKLATAIAPCEGNQVLIKLNKKISCNSIAANGSDFTLRPSLAPVISAMGVSCSPGLETDSIVLTLGGNLPTGTYTLVIKNGTDGNTLADACRRTIPVNDSINNISVVAHPLVTMDSLAKVGCKPQELVLVFKEPVRCTSIAQNGSDFSITGPSAVTITQAAGTCLSGFTNTIKLTLATIITTGGNYTLTLKNGSDANTLLNECNKAALPGGSLTLVTGDTVAAAFSSTIGYSCTGADTVRFFHNGLNGVTQWHWSFDNGSTSFLQNPTVYYSTFGTRHVSLNVTNGFCNDSVTQTIFIDTDTLHAAFETASFLCPLESLTIANNSGGSIASYAWDFGDGTSANVRDPLPHGYPTPIIETFYTIRLTLTGTLGCTDDTTVRVRALNNCVIAVPNGFTPNGDGLNDFLYPTNAYKAGNLIFRVFNRFGQLMFEARNPLQRWDGKYQGEPQPTGAYVWMLSYTDTENGKLVNQKGTTVLLR